MQALTPQQKAKAKQAVIQKMVEAESLGRGMASMVAMQTSEYKALKESVREAIERAYRIIEEYRPENGKTPVKGKDYFTKEEKDAFISSVVDEILPHIPSASSVASLIMPHIRQPEDGKTPTKKEIREIIRGLVPATNEDLIAAKVRSGLNIPKQITIEEILAAIREKKLIKTNDVDGLEQTIRALHSQIGNKGYLHGGGDTVAAGTGITLVRNANGTVTISSTGGGGGYTVETPVGDVDSSNDSFTVTTEPVYVVADGVTYFEGAGYAYSALAITMDSPPTSFIRSFHS